MDLVLNNLQWLICHKTKPTNQPIDKKIEIRIISFKQFVYFSSSNIGNLTTYLNYIENLDDCKIAFRPNKEIIQSQIKQEIPLFSMLDYSKYIA